VRTGRRHNQNFNPSYSTWFGDRKKDVEDDRTSILMEGYNRDRGTAKGVPQGNSRGVKLYYTALQLRKYRAHARHNCEPGRLSRYKKGKAISAIRHEGP
jgi:hypothetical protein